MPDAKDKQGDVTREPVYWFCVLDRAIANGDLQTAMNATECLKSLGVHVRYGRPPKMTTAKGTNHGG
jgi:hypothetical protein